MFSFLKQDLKILRFFDLELKLKMLALFLSLKDNTEYMYILNQHWIGEHPMQCCPNRLIYITFSGLLTNGRGWQKSPPPENLLHISYNYETWLNCTYPKKIQKIFKSRYMPLEFCRHQHFFTVNQQILLYQEIQILHFDT